MMCWAFIWPAMKVVSMRTYCKRLSMGLTIQACQRRSMFTMGELLFREEECVQDRGGGKVNNAERSAFNSELDTWERRNFKRNGKTIDASGKTIYAQYECFIMNMYYYSFHIEVIEYSFLPFGALGRKLGKARWMVPILVRRLSWASLARETYRLALSLRV
jgi:hypothetical protein